MANKVKLDIKTYKELKKMLIASNEDFEIACSNIKNIDISNIAIVILAKCLIYGKRQVFVNKFEKCILSILEIKDSSKIDLSWDNLFFRFSKNLNITDFDKEIINLELDTMVEEALQSLEFTFINKVKLELKW